MVFHLVDLFDMKTCAFGGARPLAPDRGLFRGDDDPVPAYRFTPCHQLTCHCCYPFNSELRQSSWLVLDFAHTSMHRFLNDYTTFLNCPMVGERAWCP